MQQLNLPLTTDLTSDDVETSRELVDNSSKQYTQGLTNDSTYVGPRCNLLAHQKAEEFRQMLSAHRQEHQLVILQDFRKKQEWKISIIKKISA